MDLTFFIPSYFEWWHVPLVFLTGLFAEGYGAIVGGGSILTQFVLVSLGMPLNSVVATDIAAVIATDLGIFVEVKGRVLKQKKLLILLGLSLFIGGVFGTYLLSNIEVEMIKNTMVVALIFLLVYYLWNHKKFKEVKTPHITLGKGFLLFGFMLLLGLYSNLISMGEGTFAKLAMIVIFGMSFVGSHGIKSLAILPTRVYSFVVTVTLGLIAWPYLLTLWVSNFLAGKYATKFIKKIPEVYLRRVLLCVVCAYLLLLLLGF